MDPTARKAEDVDWQWTVVDCKRLCVSRHSVDIGWMSRNLHVREIWGLRGSHVQLTHGADYEYIYMYEVGPE